MTVIFSKKCEYGIQAALYLAAQENNRVIPADMIAGELGIPKEFVSKILQNLTENGIILSRKGKNGGFALARKASKIKLIDIVSAIDGMDVFNNCVLGFPKCDPYHPCPVHIKWGELRDKALEMLNGESIDKLKGMTLEKINSGQEGLTAKHTGKAQRPQG